MTIFETFVKLRDDLKTWVTKNLESLNANKADRSHPHTLDDLPDTAFIITASKGSDSVTIDKTMAEIEEAYQAKQPIYCDYTSTTYAMLGKNRLSLYKRNSSTKWEFAGIVNGSTTSVYIMLTSSSITETVSFLAETALATPQTSGLMSGEDKNKLDSMNLTWQSY